MRRLTVLGALVVFLAVLITPTLRSYLRAQGDINGMRSQVASQQADIRSLQAQQKEWNDPAYVKAQAAKRLGFVAPGGTLTIVVDKQGTTHPVTKSGVVAATTASSTHPWYGQLWQSLVRTPPR
ncbi:MULTISPECIES: FtsB family cell division protein [Allobranchiibius]|uniref:Cell division protein FtsB n=1 Tax=Allobranchiibius huperziae TaxID=1874116 RepID=A0A853DG76_9MICO|nr:MULTISPECIES: septum formation initiator family protein [Allobranchiibius]NYJ73700.1 cell division protein FtsB [Allobranchiibius huperziae]UIJ34854.1 septum formation initiator family protein [Allobranchiibius sp. GilTou73]